MRPVNLTGSSTGRLLYRNNLRNKCKASLFIQTAVRTSLLCFRISQYISIDTSKCAVYEDILGCIQKFPDRVDNEIYVYLWYYSLRSNTKCYGSKTH